MGTVAAAPSIQSIPASAGPAPPTAGVDRDLGPQAVRLQLGDQLGDTRGIESVGVLDYVSHDVSHDLAPRWAGVTVRVGGLHH